MKKYRTFIIVGAVLLLIALGVGGYYYYQTTQKQEKAKQTEEKAVEAGKAGKATAKEDTSSQVVTPVQTKPSTTTTPVPETLGTISEISLTVQLYSQESIASDGTTPVPVGSIVPTFYPQSGTYTVQKMEAGAWKDIITAQAYPGHGGLSAWFAGPTEDNISYRVLRIEGGKPTAASKIFVVKRSDLGKGYFTYN